MYFPKQKLNKIKIGFKIRQMKQLIDHRDCIITLPEFPYNIDALLYYVLGI